MLSIQKEKEINTTEKLVGIADTINHKRREEIFRTYQNSDLMNELQKIRSLGIYNKGNKSKTMRKVASIPFEVDAFFTKVYGPNYYKDKDFFKTEAPEWSVLERSQI
jgi:hypothetical protein